MKKKNRPRVFTAYDRYQKMPPEERTRIALAIRFLGIYDAVKALPKQDVLAIYLYDPRVRHMHWVYQNTHIDTSLDIHQGDELMYYTRRCYSED